MQNSYSGARFRSALKSFLIGRAAQGLASLVFIIVSVRLLDPKDFGVYMTLWGMLETMVPVSSMGMLEAVRRFLPDIAMRGSRLAVREFAVRITAVRATVLLSWTVLAGLFWIPLWSFLGLSEPAAAASLPAVGLIVTVLGARFACEMLECLLEQKYSQRVQAGLQVGRLIGLLSLYSAGHLSLRNMLLVDLLVSGACLIVAEISLSVRVRSIPANGSEGVDWRVVSRFAVNCAVANLLQAIGSVGLSRAIIARVLGFEAAGAFSFVQQLLTIVNRYMPSQLLANIIRPLLLTRYVQGDKKILGVGLSLLSKSNLLIVGLCLVSLSASGDFFIGLLSSGRFPMLGAVTIAMFCGLLASTQSLVFEMMAQILDRTVAFMSLSVLFLLLPLAQWFGAEYGGLLGAAIGLGVARAVIAILGWPMLVSGARGIDANWGRLILVSAGILTGSAIAYGLGVYVGPWWALVGSLLVYVAIVYVIKPLDGNDIDFFGKIARGKSKRLGSLLLAWSR